MTRPLHLYEIPEALRRIDDEIAAAGGELSPELAERLDELDMNIADKFDALAALVREREARSIAIWHEAARLKEAAVAEDNAAERLKDYAVRSLTALGRDKVEGVRFKVAVRRNSRPAIRWAGPGGPPPGFVRSVETLDGQAAYDAYRENRLPDGFIAVIGKHLSIR